MTDQAADTSHDDRYRRGAEVLDEIHGQSIFDLVDDLQDISPEMGYQVVAWAYGEMYSRPNLSHRDRQLVTLGMLTSQGGEESELRAHIPLALEVGVTPDEIIEVFLHSIAYCGFPRAINGTKVAKQIFAERKLI
jgi:4-carboxymuconolactone decarboxylase